jgi:hypothetical protein
MNAPNGLGNFTSPNAGGFGQISSIPDMANRMPQTKYSQKANANLPPMRTGGAGKSKLPPLPSNKRQSFQSAGLTLVGQPQSIISKRSESYDGRNRAGYVSHSSGNGAGTAAMRAGGIDSFVEGLLANAHAGHAAR